MDFRSSGGKLAAMSQPQNASGVTVFFLITLTAIYWGTVLLFALAQFWVICDPAMTPGCTTPIVSALRAMGMLLGGAVVFCAATLAIRALFHWK